MRISAFGDELATDFEAQVQGLHKLGIPHIDVRKAWGVVCTDFTADHIQNINTLCADNNVSVACIGSPIGKSPIAAPISNELERLARIAEVAHALGTTNIRMFSFRPDGDVTEAVMDDAITRLQQLTDRAGELDVQLLLENEKHLVGDLPERCHTILAAINHPRLRFIWDPANFVQCGAANQVTEWWGRLHPFIAYVHIKDAILGEGRVVPVGEGDGQVDQLLANLLEKGYDGVLSLEPHLKIAGPSGGYSGAEKMEIAVMALRKLMREVGIEERKEM